MTGRALIKLGDLDIVERSWWCRIGHMFDLDFLVRRDCKIHVQVEDRLLISSHDIYWNKPQLFLFFLVAMNSSSVFFF